MTAVTAAGEATFTLLGVGAMNSPRYAPAGLLVTSGDVMVAIDGGPGAEPAGPLDAWLLTDARCELISPLRHLARRHGVEAKVAAFRANGLTIEPQPVVHTSHPTYGYLILEGSNTAGSNTAGSKTVGSARVVWAPEFYEFPLWAAGADLLFADAAGWSHPIRFAGGVGGHAPVQDVAEQARIHGVRRVVYAHIGRPTIAAMDKGLVPSFGEYGVEGSVYTSTNPGRVP